MTENQQRIASGSFHDNVLVITIREDEIGEPETSHALRDEILSLVDGQKLSGTWRVWNVGDLLDHEDQALDARMHVSRYQCIRLRT